MYDVHVNKLDHDGVSFIRPFYWNRVSFFFNLFFCGTGYVIQSLQLPRFEKGEKRFAMLNPYGMTSSQIFSRLALPLSQ